MARAARAARASGTARWAGAVRPARGSVGLPGHRGAAREGALPVARVRGGASRFLAQLPPPPDRQEGMGRTSLRSGARCARREGRLDRVRAHEALVHPTSVAPPFSSAASANRRKKAAGLLAEGAHRRVGPLGRRLQRPPSAPSALFLCRRRRLRPRPSGAGAPGASGSALGEERGVIARVVGKRPRGAPE